MTSWEKRLEDAIRAKDEGNAALQQGQVKRASFLYKTVHMHLGDLVSKGGAAAGGAGGGSDDMATGIVQMLGGGNGGPAKPSPPPDLQAAIDTVYTAVQNNLALTHLKLGRVPESIRCATYVLDRQPNNIKARFRRATGRMSLGLLDEAMLDVEQILQESPEDPEALRLRQELQAKLAESTQKEKKMFQKMFA